MNVETFGYVGVLFLVIIWEYEGFVLKFMDSIIDDHIPVRTWYKWLVIIMAGLCAGFFMCIDNFTNGAVLALIIGMILAKKIDNRLWVIQISIVIAFYAAFLALFYLFWPNFSIDWLQVLAIFVIIIIFSILDEVTHEKVQLMKDSTIKSIVNARLLLKVVVVLMWFPFGLIMWYHAVAWWLFDMTYEITGKYYAKSDTVVIATSSDIKDAPIS
jgi:hypothetical protein